MAGKYLPRSTTASIDFAVELNSRRLECRFSQRVLKFWRINGLGNLRQSSVFLVEQPPHSAL